MILRSERRIHSTAIMHDEIFSLLSFFLVVYARSRTTTLSRSRDDWSRRRGMRIKIGLSRLSRYYVGRIPLNLSALKFVTTHRADRPINRDIHACITAWCARSRARVLVIDAVLKIVLRIGHALMVLKEAEESRSSTGTRRDT